MNRSNTRQTILQCLEANITNAKTRAMREHAKQQLDNYVKHLATHQTTTIELPCKTTKRQPNWDRLIPGH